MCTSGPANWVFVQLYRMPCSMKLGDPASAGKAATSIRGPPAGAPFLPFFPSCRALLPLGALLLVSVRVSVADSARASRIMRAISESGASMS